MIKLETKSNNKDKQKKKSLFVVVMCDQNIFINKNK